MSEWETHKQICRDVPFVTNLLGGHTDNRWKQARILLPAFFDKYEEAKANDCERADSYFGGKDAGLLLPWDAHQVEAFAGIAVRTRIQSRGFSGLPDLYTYIVTIEEHAGIFLPRSTLSIEMAVDEIKDAAGSVDLGDLSNVLSDSPNVRLFALAVSPKSLRGTLATPAAGRADAAEYARARLSALLPLIEVMETWRGTDAQMYVDGLTKEQTEVGLDRIRKIERRLRSVLLSLGENGTKRGRRPKAGKEHLIAKVIAASWEMCGLGRPKLSSQSRFIKACAAVLPWHGVHKADVAQFMRTELEKKDVVREGRDGVLID